MIAFTLGYMLRKKGKERELSKLRHIQAQGEQLKGVEQVKEQNKQNERLFELYKIKKQFEYDYYLQHNKYPSALMNEARQQIPAEQASQESMSQMPQMGQQPPVGQQEAANV